MLLAVEGGGFFSSSASGYSKGLTLLLLGQKNEEKPMRVTPWNQYQLVDQEMDPETKLAPGKNWLVRGCTSFVCFGHASGLENPSPLKVGPAQNLEVPLEPPDVDKSKDQPTYLSETVDHGSTRKIISLKSSLKKSPNSFQVAATCVDVVGIKNEHKVLCGKGDFDDCQTEKRRVQWTDEIGGDLFEVREFEMSDDGFDDEFEHGNDKTCSCIIM